MFWVLLLIVAPFVFILAIIKMALDHHEKIVRIRYGLPAEGEREEYGEPKRRFS
ncbi:MAG: hypothetical protein LBT59_03185 [Clostridiales bacterium]|nr:hypothetical protein [Clostridiales bacterium]